MEPKIKDFSEDNDILKFTLYDCNYSIANSIRRTILSDIETVVIATDDDSVLVNTSRLNNEIIKQRLGCIPVHIVDKNIPIKNYTIEIDVTNDTDKLLFVTTEDIKIKDNETKTYLSKEIVQQMFPKNLMTGYYIDILRLRPKLYEGHVGEKIHIACSLKYATAGENGMYNVASTCTYGNTIDNTLAKDALEDELEKIKGAPEEQIIKFKNDWNALNIQRYYVKNSFDFSIETVGIHKNMDLVKNAINVLITKLQNLMSLFQNKGSDLISEIYSTIDNYHELELEDIGYTIGKLLEYKLYEEYFEKEKIFNFCGFIKKHPHSNKSYIKFGFNDSNKSLDDIVMILINSTNDIIKEIQKIGTYFE